MRRRSGKQARNQRAVEHGPPLRWRSQVPKFGPALLPEGRNVGCSEGIAYRPSSLHGAGRGEDGGKGGDQGKRSTARYVLDTAPGRPATGAGPRTSSSRAARPPRGRSPVREICKSTRWDLCGGRRGRRRSYRGTRRLRVLALEGQDVRRIALMRWPSFLKRHRFMDV